MPKSKKNGAIELLKQDHREVEALFEEFEQLEKDGAAAVEQVIASACTELRIHDSRETELLYRRCANAPLSTPSCNTS